jgi:hypothetical protein
MWYRSYRDHAIMAFPSYDTATSLWAPQASISWVDGPVRKSQFVRFTKRVFTESDAVATALSGSCAWIDRRLKTIDKAPQLAGPHQGHSITRSGVFGGDTNTDVRALKSSRSAPQTMTYPQFKSLMEKSGFGGNERSLQKSYMALAQLRRQNHCSWARIRSKMEQSQQMPAALHAKAAKTKPSPLPLTLRAWRRVI